MPLSFRRIISASLSPNTEGDDVLRALRMIMMPWAWKRGKYIARIESWFSDRFRADSAVSFNSGRSAQLAILEAFGIGEGDEVIVQAFTCVAVPNSVMWAGATPMYVDIDATLNIDVADLKKKITSKTKAIIVQHTLGVPAKIDEIMTVARKHKIVVIEDCAHALGATYQGKPVGSLADAAFFSFGRDKVLSSVFGGMAVINGSKFKVQSSKLREYQKKLPYPSFVWIFRQLVHPAVFAVVLPLYTLGIGKVILVVLQKLKLLSFPVYPEEKVGKRPGDFPAKYPNALAFLLVGQLAKLIRFNATRKSIAESYMKTLSSKKVSFVRGETGATYLRFSLFTNNPDELRLRARKHGILLGNWYHNAIDPSGTDFGAIGYKIGSCPKAEEAAEHIVNLPTRISDEEAGRVISLL